MPLNRVGYALWSLILQCVADDQKEEIGRVLCVHVRDFCLFDPVISSGYHAGYNAAVHSLLLPIKLVDRSFCVIDATLVKCILCYRSKLNSV